MDVYGCRSLIKAGVFLQKTGNALPAGSEAPSARQAEDVEETEHEPVNILEEQATFDSIVVWDHEVVPDESNDPYVKGIEEWVAFAEQVSTVGGMTNDTD